MMNEDWLSDAFKTVAVKQIMKKMLEDQMVNPRQKMSEREYERLEYSSFIETTVTDKDLLKLHIDIALQNKDKEAFMKLTNQLQEVTV